MAMRDITDLMNTYRECSRNLWNVYFSTLEYASESTCAYKRIRELLFESLVSDKLLYEEGPDHDVPPPPVLIVVPRPVAIILIQRLSGPGEARYWDQEKDLIVEEGDIRLQLLDYFDWSDYPIQDFHFYLCKILSFPNHNEYEGRQALIEVPNCRVFHDEDADAPPNS